MLFQILPEIIPITNDNWHTWQKYSYSTFGTNDECNSRRIDDCLSWKLKLADGRTWTNDNKTLVNCGKYIINYGV